MEINDFTAYQHRRWPDFWTGEDRLKAQAALDRARHGDRSTFEGQMATFNGTLKWWEVQVAPIMDQQGVAGELVAVSTDITARKQAEQALNALNAELERQVQDRVRQLNTTAQAHQAFMAFTEAVGIQTDVAVLAKEAVKILQHHFPNASIGYYSREHEVWTALAWSDDLSSEAVQVITAGVSSDHPVIAEVLAAREAVFDYTYLKAVVRSPASYQAVGSVPVTLGGEVCGLLSVGFRTTPVWSEQDQQLLRAVTRGLNLALERSAYLQRLETQNAELAAQARALESVARLSAELALLTDRRTLIRRALELVLSVLPEGEGAFYERAGPVWRVAVQSGDGFHAFGESVGHAPSLGHLSDQREPLFQHAWHPFLKRIPEQVASVGACATLPLLLNGEVSGLFIVSLSQKHDWSTAERTMLITTVRSLELVIEGAIGAAHLTRERQLLALTTAELESFVYSASHDLRTPVRHVMSFAELARRALITTPNEKASHYIEVMQQAASEMSGMIDAMLLLSRVGRHTVVLRAVDLEQVVTQIRWHLMAAVPHLSIDWQVAALPTVISDLSLLQQAMTQLLDNAVKFSSTQAAPHIQVWAEENDTGWTVFVRDNGVGFDPTYQHKLFGVFQRLHREKHFGGAGVGLATVRRIVIKLGGEVFADSQVNQGATFGFTLPVHS
ncbi:hypothetical protein GCM10008957_56710 [Deinococcus ruber]|uniref:histidine kinase n=2 Tax=Deinococcus ruber TaxID=1848197 RepID=A0A918KXU8_9DEIO|nr:hypothetical protein GCM10008957_56710 [Deinococcus ruber]